MAADYESIHSFIHSFTHSLIHSLIHSFTHSFIHQSIIEKPFGQRRAVRELLQRSQLVKEGMAQHFAGYTSRHFPSLTRQSVLWDVHQQLAHQIDRLRVVAMHQHLHITPLRLAHLAQILMSDIRKLPGIVVRIHPPHLLVRRRPQHLDDLDHLSHVVLAREQRGARQKLGHDARHAPDVHRHRVVRRAEDQLRRAVVARADVADVGLVGGQALRAAEVADLDHVCLGIDEHVLRFDVAVADAARVDVGEAFKHLVGIQLE